jgi:hypothetical protein
LICTEAFYLAFLQQNEFIESTMQAGARGGAVG